MILALLLLGCTDSEPVDSTPQTTVPTGTSSTETSWPTSFGTTSEWVATSGPAVDLRALAEADGWTVQDGAFVFSTMEHCCDIGVSCLGNNPHTPYGLAALPPAPDSGMDSEVDMFWMWGDNPRPGLSKTFRMRQKEAVVIIGEMPPTAKYFGLRSSVADRLVLDTGQRELAGGSMGPVTNQLTIASDRGVEVEDIWSSPIAVISAADYETEASVAAWLDEMGFGGVTHLDRISADDALMGVEPESDTMMVAARVAVPDDPDAMAAYQASPPLQVLRLTPPPGSASAPMGRQPLPERGSGRDESDWQEALNALQLSVLERFEGYPVRHDTITAGFTPTFTCMEDLSCIGDVRDRFASRSDTLPLGDDEVIVLLGVNHERTGRASYSNFAIMVQDNWVGAAAVHSAQMVGSARPWLFHPQVDDLYAYVLARDCAPYADLTCLEIGDTCPWPTRSEPFWITWRMYLDPRTGAAPVREEMIDDRILRFTVPP